MKCWSEPSTKDAYRLSWASLIITLVAAISGIAIWKSLDSSLALVFGLENCVDFFSSAVVLWRFFAPYKLDEEMENKLKRRELKASVAISIILVLLGIMVVITSADDVARGQEEDFEQTSALFISIVSVPIFGVLAMLKFRYSKALESPSLYKDGICSLIGTLLALALFFNTIIVENSPEAWWMDPVIAIFAGLVAMLYGVHGLYVSKVRDKTDFFSPSWWTSNKGNAPVPDSTPAEAGSTEMVDTEIV